MGGWLGDREYRERVSERPPERRVKSEPKPAVQGLQEERPEKETRTPPGGDTFWRVPAGAVGSEHSDAT